MDTGFITLHRKILDNPIWKHDGLVHLFVHLLLLATYKQDRFIWNGKEEVLERGQLITGRYSLAESLNTNPNTTYKRLKLLEKLGIINIKSNNKFSVITIVKYSDYQDKDNKRNSRSNNKVTTKEQQNNTLNNVNNVNKESGDESPALPAKEFFTNKEKQKEIFTWLTLTGIEESVARTELWEFIKYWKEKNAKGRERWEAQKFFDIKRRIGTWLRNIK